MEELLKQVNEYLESKIPEVPKSTRDEIATFLIYRFAIHEADIVERTNREWKQQLLDRRADNLRKEIAHLMNKKGEGK